VTGGTTGADRVGAAGRDFYNFNVVYRDDPTTTVVTFTATQIPGIAGRRYPPSLAGPRHRLGRRKQRLPVSPSRSAPGRGRRPRPDDARG